MGGGAVTMFVAGVRRRKPINAEMSEALQETRWLGGKHRRQLAEGRLRLPDQANHFGYGGHPAVLMSIPDGFGSPVAWIDRGMADLIWRLNKHGADTEECCQGQPGYDVWGELGSAYIAFATRHGSDLFLSLAGDALRGEQVERQGRVRVVRFAHNWLHRVTLAVRNT